MEQKDIFQEIATDRMTPGERQGEVRPLPLPQRYLQEKAGSFPEKVWFGNRIPFRERLEDFYAKLEEMRRQYAPFMENKIPFVDTCTQTVELEHFQFRYQEKGERFTRRMRPDAGWEKVTIPDYRGPAGEAGKWKGYYQTEFATPEIPEHKRLIIWFQSVDYIARVYVNGNFVGSHEGFFAPFSFDITSYVEPVGEKNELTVEVWNDIPVLGVGDYLDGDKIYGATGPGWDDPDTGWHHCPAGAGITGRVTLEVRPVVYVEDIVVFPDIDRGAAQVRVGVMNYTDNVLTDYFLEFSLLPRNFTGDPLAEYRSEVKYIGAGKNEYRYVIPLEGFRLWNPEEPWLYGAVASLRGETGVSRKTETVGIKKFVSDGQSIPKGKFYLNNSPVVLRGANEMGHLQQCVMKKDFGQLRDDILIAKMCHMNYYRVTQRPVQREIYDYFDMLGMMHQCDLPLFSFLRRPQFAEAVKQCIEMEHLIRSHVSSAMVTFINESMSIRKNDDPDSPGSRRSVTKGHRHLLRDELEAFFVAARQAIYTENPDRVIKNAEGDYEPPTMEGMPDFHCYTMWYSNHGQPLGKLMKGYLPPVKEGWKIGCGEYGAEGLDSLEVMRECYPEAWLKPDAEGHWYPDRIPKAQMHGLHGDWFAEQDNLKDWIRESQIHQAQAARLMTDAFRRRADLIQQTAIHLLIDAWPAGWMKTLVDCRRIPKRAYFAYMDSLIQVRMNFNCSRKYGYAGEEIPVEVWLLNDSGCDRELEVTVTWQMEMPGTQIPGAGISRKTPSTETPQENREASGRQWQQAGVAAQEAAGMESGPGRIWQGKGSVKAADSICMGVWKLKLPQVTEPVKLTAMGSVSEGGASTFRTDGRLYGEEMQIYVYPRVQEMAPGRVVLPVLTKENGEELAREITRITGQGRTAVLLLGEDREAVITVEERSIGQKKCQEVFFAAASPDYEKYHLSMLYNEREGYIDILGKYAIDTSLPGVPKVYTYARNGFSAQGGAKEKLPFVEEFRIGAGRLLVVSLELEGRRGVNPNLDALLLGI